MLLCQKRLVVSWAALAGVLPVGQGKLSFSSVQQWPRLEYYVQFGAPLYERVIGILEKV